MNKNLNKLGKTLPSITLTVESKFHKNSINSLKIIKESYFNQRYGY